MKRFIDRHPSPAARVTLLLLTALALLLLPVACGQPTAGNPLTTVTLVPPTVDGMASDAEQPTATAAALTGVIETTAEPYPPPAGEAATTGGYPAPTDVEAVTPAIGSPDSGDADATATAAAIFFPIIGEGAPGDDSAAEAIAVAEPSPSVTPLPTVTPTLPPPTATPTPAGPPPPTPTPTPFPPVDFESARAELTAAGQALAYNKIGLHVTFPENNKELDTYMQRLDAAGVPFFLKSVDNAEPIYRAQELMKQSGVDHTLVFRSTKYDVPDYTADPVAAADTYWELEKETWPPELDPSLVWFETMNEVDRNESEWLARFSLRTAELALRDGYKWAAFGWASGEPEPEAWRAPAMLEFLRLVAQHPDQLAIALHEYSYLAEDIGHDYPYKIGRFLDLFQAADENGIPRPTVLITEWGWTYNNIPPEPDAMEDVEWAAELYGAFPQVKGAAIWNLGKLDDIILPLNSQVGDLVDPLMVYSLTNYFPAPASRNGPISPESFPPPP